jgi:hypothetical protein
MTASPEIAPRWSSLLGGVGDARSLRSATATKSRSPSAGNEVSEVKCPSDVTRCTDRQPCEDVVANLRAADRALDLPGIDHDHPLVKVLRVKAARIAAGHDYGQTS